jgi:hypothetical protein
VDRNDDRYGRGHTTLTTPHGLHLIAVP